MAGIPAPNFDADEAVRELARADAVLGGLIERVGPLDLRTHRMVAPFPTLMEAIVHQQLTTKAAQTILGRVVDLFAPRDFPTPEDILESSEEQLRSAGLSRSKVLALRDLAARTLAGSVPTLEELEAMADDDVVRHLTAVRGIGRWTAEMFLIFRLGRPDVLPIDDHGLRRGFRLTYGTSAIPKPAEIAEYGVRWRPYRTVASWYLWQALETTDLT